MQGIVGFDVQSAAELQTVLYEGEVNFVNLKPLRPIPFSLLSIAENPFVIWTVAVTGVTLLVATWWLLRFRHRKRYRAATICLLLSVLLHGGLFWLVPLVNRLAGTGSDTTGSADASVSPIPFTFQDPDQSELEPLPTADVPAVPPLPVASTEIIASDRTDPELVDPVVTPDPSHAFARPQEPFSTIPPTVTKSIDPSLDKMLSDLIVPNAVSRTVSSPNGSVAVNPVRSQRKTSGTQVNTRSVPSVARSGSQALDPTEKPFAVRFGDARQAALLGTGGDVQTEAAVARSLRWLSQTQRSDGSWDPGASGAGVERSPLGLNRSNAGKRATTGITGLALLALLGAGNTHKQGPYAANVRAGLGYLIRVQEPNGSLAGNATSYARTYCHGMAGLALCEAAAITKDPVALSAADAAIRHTVHLQDRRAGGWRYKAGQAGDLSQLGWQAMVLDSGRRAGIPIPATTWQGTTRFLRSVRGGQSGGLASYRAGERVSRTMTAEALATRLLLGEQIPDREIAEAERFILEEVPGRSQANFYYWYYASLALHQLQDEAWETWNQHLKQHLLSTQKPDGSWSANSVWGGYGGHVYTASLGCLCLEVYYRHKTPQPLTSDPPNTFAR